MKFYNQNLGFAVNSDYNGKFIMNRTEDGGQTWQSFTLPASGWASDLEFIPGNPSNIWYSDLTNLFFSSDTGKTWQEIPGLSSIRDIKFTDANHGWMIGDNSNIYKTSNNYPTQGIAACKKFYPSSESKKGFSNALTTQRKNLIPSAPSMIL